MDEPPPPSPDDYQQMTKADWRALYGPLADEQATTPATLSCIKPAEPPAANDPEPPDPWEAGIARLQHMPAPAGFGIDAWKLVRLGCATLLRTCGDEMHRLGWSAEDAFGIHPTAPGAAIHCYGLGVLLKGGGVVELTADGASIETADGSRHSFRRTRRKEAVPVWTL